MITQVVFVIGSKAEQHNKEWSYYNKKFEQLLYLKLYQALTPG